MTIKSFFQSRIDKFDAIYVFVKSKNILDYWRDIPIDNKLYMNCVKIFIKKYGKYKIKKINFGETTSTGTISYLYIYI